MVKLIKIIVLLSDAHGGRGGIAKFNRDLLRAFSSSPVIGKTDVFPRIFGELSGVPPKVTYYDSGKNKIGYVLNLFWSCFAKKPYDLIVCGHINLLPLAIMLKAITQTPVILITHGVEVWDRPNFLRRFLSSKIDLTIAVSEFTKNKFLQWSKHEKRLVCVVPNCVDFNVFCPGSKNEELINLYKLDGKKVLLTLARLDAREKYKGIDEILDAFSYLASKVPNLVYLIVGDGSDRTRLVKKSQDLGISASVIFTGYIDEDQKVDYYRISDAFAMPGRGEGFGIVYLEAMACGVPSVGSILDGSRDALMEGKLGVLVNPLDQANLCSGILTALSKPHGVPQGIDFFSQENFDRRIHEILQDFHSHKKFCYES